MLLQKYLKNNKYNIRNDLSKTENIYGTFLWKLLYKIKLFNRFSKFSKPVKLIL